MLNCDRNYEMATQKNGEAVQASTLYKQDEIEECACAGKGATPENWRKVCNTDKTNPQIAIYVYAIAMHIR